GGDQFAARGRQRSGVDADAFRLRARAPQVGVDARDRQRAVAGDGAACTIKGGRGDRKASFTCVRDLPPGVVERADGNQHVAFRGQQTLIAVVQYSVDIDGKARAGGGLYHARGIVQPRRTDVGVARRRQRAAGVVEGSGYDQSTGVAAGGLQQAATAVECARRQVERAIGRDGPAVIVQRARDLQLQGTVAGCQQASVRRDQPVAVDHPLPRRRGGVLQVDVAAGNAQAAITRDGALGAGQDPGFDHQLAVACVLHRAGGIAKVRGTQLQVTATGDTSAVTVVQVAAYIEGAGLRATGDDVAPTVVHLRGTDVDPGSPQGGIPMVDVASFQSHFTGSDDLPAGPGEGPGLERQAFGARVFDQSVLVDQHPTVD